MPKGFNSFGKKERAAGGLNPYWWSKGLTFWAPFDRVADPLKLNRGVSAMTFVRATTATYFPPGSGTRSIASAGELRIEANGALIEGQRTNHFLQSDAPATQTSGSLGTGTYTLWMEGTGSIAVSANSATITGAGTATDGNPVTFVVTGAGTVDYTVTGSPTIAQAEDGPFPSSYIPTTTAAVTRNADKLTMYATPALVSEPWTALYDEPATISFSIDIRGILAEAVYVLGNLWGNASGSIFATAGNFRMYDGVSSPKNLSVLVHGGTQQKAAFSWGGTLKGVTDGGTVASVAYSGMGFAPYLTLGSQNGDNNIFGHIKNLRIWNRSLLDSELQAITQ